MASKSLPSSSGYFNKKMLSILDAGEKKPASKNTTTTKSTGGKKK